MAGVDERTRQMVMERDLFRCQRCGTYCGPFGDFSVHHRRPRGMGGSRDPLTNQSANLTVLCGTGTTGCHGHVESHRDESLETGFLVHQGTDPSTIPVHTHQGWVLLDNDGNYYPYSETP